MTGRKCGSSEDTVKSPPFTRRYRSSTLESAQGGGEKFREVVEKEVRRNEKEIKERGEKRKDKFRDIVEKEVRQNAMSGLRDNKTCDKRDRDSNLNCENESRTQKKETLRHRSSNPIKPFTRMLSNPLSPIISKKKLSTTKSTPVTPPSNYVTLTPHLQVKSSRSLPHTPSPEEPLLHLQSNSLPGFPPKREVPSSRDKRSNSSHSGDKRSYLFSDTDDHVYGKC